VKKLILKLISNNLTKIGLKRKERIEIENKTIYTFGRYFFLSEEDRKYIVEAGIPKDKIEDNN